MPGCSLSTSSPRSSPAGRPRGDQHGALVVAQSAQLRVEIVGVGQALGEARDQLIARRTVVVRHAVGAGHPTQRRGGRLASASARRMRCSVREA